MSNNIHSHFACSTLLFIFVYVGFIHTIKEGLILPVWLALWIKTAHFTWFKIREETGSKKLGVFAFSVCKRSRTTVCRVSLHKTCSCEISLICSHIQWFSVALTLLTALEFSCLSVILLSSKPSPIHHLFFRSLYCYRLPLSTYT